MPRATASLTSFVALLLTACGPTDPPPPPPIDVAPASPAVTVAFTLPQGDLLPENIAFDPVDEAFYIGSSRYGKIVRRSADGTVSDFTAARQDGLWMVMGMKVDAERRHLWVASSDGDNLVGYERSRQRAAGIFQYDLESGSLVRKWTLDEGVHFYNDLVVTPEGVVYATHMFNRPQVHVIGADGELQVFARPGNFKAPNGIVLGADGTVYVAHTEGLSAFDPTTAQRTPLLLPPDASFSRIDGLYLHGGDLIGLHPEEGLIRRFTLDGTTVTRIEELPAEHAALGGLTTAVLVDDTLYFVADSQFDRLDGGVLPGADDLDDIVVLRLVLD